MTTLYVGNRRLLKLASYLEGVDARRKLLGLPGYEQGAFQHACGTPACALGTHAANNRRRWLLPGPIECGEFGQHTGSPRLKSVPEVNLDGCRVYDPTVASGVHEFALGTSDEFTELFGGRGCGRAETGKQAARYIRKFVARRVTAAEKAKKRAA